MDENAAESDEDSDDVPEFPLVKLRPLEERLAYGKSLSKKDKLLLFAQAVASGKDLVEAYMGAFGDENLRPTVIQKRALKLAADPRTMKLVSDEKTRRQSKGFSEGDRLRTFVTARLEHEALHAKSATGRIQALKLIGDLGHVQAFREPEAGQVPEIPTDLEDRIKAILNG